MDGIEKRNNLKGESQGFFFFSNYSFNYKGTLCDIMLNSIIFDIFFSTFIKYTILSNLFN